MNNVKNGTESDIDKQIKESSEKRLQLLSDLTWTMMIDKCRALLYYCNHKTIKKDNQQYNICNKCGRISKWP